MPSRQYDVEAEGIIPDGIWPGQPIDLPNERTALEGFMLDMATILERIGGTLSIVALRREIAPDLFVPVGFRAKWDTYAPAQRLPKQAVKTDAEVPPPPPEPEPQPAEDDPLTDEELADHFPEDGYGADAAGDEDDFGPDAEEALREQALAAAAE